MAKNSAAELLTSVDSMFTTQEERDNAQRSYVTDLPTTEISDFPDHPFKVRMDESMMEMVESVKERGVLSPVLVRPKPDGGYEMVSGHRRKMAAELAEMPTVPCIVRELTDDESQQEQETDDFSDIDPAAVRAALAENGIVDGHVADPEKLDAAPFIQQVKADVGQIAADAPIPQESAEQGEKPLTVCLSVFMRTMYRAS